MLGIKLKVGLLGLLAVLLLGSYTAAPAFAEGGPFCHHRPLRGTGEGERIKAQEPEQFAGGGPKQEFTGEILLTRIVFESPQAQVKGIIYNNEDQCQAKAEITIIEPKIAVLPNCIVRVNSNNIVKLFGHQAWKWNGTRAELEERSQSRQHRDWIFLPSELQQGATRLPAGTFASISTENRSPTEICALRVTQIEVTGSATTAGFGNPQKEKENRALEVWGTQEELTTTGGEGKQHFWNGREFIGVTTGLELGRRSAFLKGKLTMNTTGRQQRGPQEIAYFES